MDSRHTRRTSIVWALALVACPAAEDEHGDSPTTGAEVRTSDGTGGSSQETTSQTNGDGVSGTSGDGASEGGAGGGACAEEDECRTAEDCMPGQLCSDCSCCDPGEEGGINLACGERPPPGKQYCVDEPDTMFFCVPPFECCGSKELCYDPAREPEFCPDD